MLLYSPLHLHRIVRPSFIVHASEPSPLQLQISHLKLEPTLPYLSIHKCTPQFPGSVTRHVPLEIFYNDEGLEDMEAISRAVETRRKVTMEILKEEMKRKGKFGITYTTNLSDALLACGFIDFLLIEGVRLKRLPEFEFSSFNYRVQEVLTSLQIVPLIRWLKHNGLSYPKIAKAFSLSRGDVGSIRRIIEWLKKSYVKGEFLGVVLSKSGPTILQRKEDDLNEIVNFLESKGIRREWMGYVISRCPQILSFSIDELTNRVEFYFSMGMNEKDFGTMVFDYPRVIGHYSIDEMHRKVEFFKELGLNEEEIGRLLAFKPQLMACSVDEKLKPLIKFFHYLGITIPGIKRILTIKPMVFCLALETNISPKVKFFQDLGLRDDAIGKMLVRFPPVLTYSLHKKLRPVVIFLVTRCGVKESDISKVISGSPELLGCSISKKLEGNMKYFLSLGIRNWELGEMIADFPMLLRYNVELLRPKYRYLRRVMVRPLKDLVEFPRFFSYSLEERITPRYEIMVKNGVNFKLRYMLGCTEEEFDEKVKDAAQRLRRFESNAGEQITGQFTEGELLE